MAFGTLFRDLLNGSAIMAFKAIAALVVCHRNAAINALNGRSAAAAKNRPRIAAAVDQDECLGLVVQAFVNACMQRGRNGAGFVSLLKLLAKTDDLNGREWPRSDTRCNCEQLIFPFSRVVIGFERRRGRTEQGKRILHLRSDDGHIASVIARRFFLLVAGFLLLVDDDEAKIF